MRAGIDDLYFELERAPEDWSIRIRLMEAAVAAEDFAEARRLVRTSPDPDRPLPGELQSRIHDLLSRRSSEVPISVSSESSRDELETNA